MSDDDRPGAARAGHGAGTGRARPARADPGRRGRQPEPGRRQRRAARHRQGVRLVADDARPHRGRLLARARGVGAVPRRARRPLRPQADADPRRVAVGPRVPDRGVRARATVCSSRAGCSAASSAGMAYPTTLALITALWSGPRRTKSIALWSALGGAISALGPLVAGALLQHFWWGSVFLVTLPLAVVALVLAIRLVPAPRERDRRSGRQPRRHPLGRARRRASCWRSTSRPCPNKRTLALGLARDRGRGRASRSSSASAARKFPLYDLDVAGRRMFWVAACAGIIVFGSLMGAMFIGQQFLQNVLGYSTLAGGRGDPARGGVHGDRRAALGEARRGQGRAVHAAHRLRVLPRSASSRCCCSGRTASRTGRSRSATCSWASASASRARPRRTRSPARCP